MHFLKQFTEKAVKYDFLTKYNYKNIHEIPKIKSIVLHIGTKQVSFKVLLEALVCLNLISAKKGFITKSSKPNIFLKIRKGSPVGCKVILKNKDMWRIGFKIIFLTLSQNKHFDGISLTSSKYSTNSFTFTIKNILLFLELEKQYELFDQNLPLLDISIITNCKTKEELHNLLTAYKLPLKI